MNETIKLGLTLLIITALAGLALALTNSYTRPMIEANIDASVKESLNVAYPEADDFSKKDGYFEAMLNGEVIGKVYNVESAGYSSLINLLVGVDLNNTIKGVSVVSQVETPGLGTKIEEPEFIDQFTGKELSNAKLKNDGGEIDAITGATISSNAVISAIQTIENE